MGAFRREQADLLPPDCPNGSPPSALSWPRTDRRPRRTRTTSPSRSSPTPGTASQVGSASSTHQTEPARVAQLQLGLDLIAANADGTVTLPMPTTAILDGEHLLRWIDVHRDYSTRSEPQQILDALDQLHL
jgi:hypothetical protein